MSDTMNWLYSEEVKDHFMNPRNVLEDPDSYQADGKGVAGNVTCGDQMMVVIQVREGIVTDCRWRTYGCASAIASTSLLSEMVKGMPVDKAYQVGPKEIISNLGGLPKNKIHCSVLGDKALRSAIEDYYRRNGMGEKIPSSPSAREEE